MLPCLRLCGQCSALICSGSQMKVGNFIPKGFLRCQKQGRKVRGYFGYAYSSEYSAGRGRKKQTLSWHHCSKGFRANTQWCPAPCRLHTSKSGIPANKGLIRKKKTPAPQHSWWAGIPHRTENHSSMPCWWKTVFHFLRKDCQKEGKTTAWDRLWDQPPAQPPTLSCCLSFLWAGLICGFGFHLTLRPQHSCLLWSSFPTWEQVVSKKAHNRLLEVFFNIKVVVLWFKDDMWWNSSVFCFKVYFGEERPGCFQSTLPSTKHHQGSDCYGSSSQLMQKLKGLLEKHSNTVHFSQFTTVMAFWTLLSSLLSPWVPHTQR